MAQDEHGAHGERANGAARHEMYMFELRVCGLMMSLLREMRASPQSAHQASLTPALPDDSPRDICVFWAAVGPGRPRGRARARGAGGGGNPVAARVARRSRALALS
mgnify:CR=1 FL=1